MNQHSVCQRTVTVNLENGLHMVPCSRIAKVSERFACEVRIRKGELIVNAKDILDLLQLDAGRGTALVLEADGDGAAEVIQLLGELFDSDFAGDEAAGE